MSLNVIQLVCYHKLENVAKSDSAKVMLVEWWQFHAAESQTIPTLREEETGPVIKGLF